MRKDMVKIWGASMAPWAILIPKNQVCNVNSFRDIMKKVLRMLKDMAKIWGASMVPWAILIPKNQICIVNSFRDIMKNVCACSRYWPKYQGYFDGPIGHPYIEPNLYLNSFRI
ncbi:hypothetical protein AVEN_90409-1 [Araneus ventricosus]|uniref:Uncharacterized protein n=1 Tax=Araneus ventricosus TaxID=182803 RepID=A0A4Y2GKZ6_ARAVE|nr:hypothetical protein AVEN_90409-1 [Araneus ventricosus]